MILITGTARSGTSLTTAVLQACGLNLGHTKLNGLNEATKVRDQLLKPYLKSVGADPMGQHPLPDLDDVRIDRGWREKVMESLGYPSEPWGYKAAKACLIWPLFAAAFPEAKWVIVRRDKEQIAQSCMRTQFMRAHRNVEGWRRWVEHHEARFEEMKGELDCVEIWPDTNPETFRPMVEACGLDWQPQAVQAVINPNKWHSAS